VSVREYVFGEPKHGRHGPMSRLMARENSLDRYSTHTSTGDTVRKPIPSIEALTSTSPPDSTGGLQLPQPWLQLAARCALVATLVSLSRSFSRRAARCRRPVLLSWGLYQHPRLDRRGRGSRVFLLGQLLLRPAY